MQEHYKKILALALSASVAIFAGFVIAFARNVPIGDDYQVLDSILAMRAAPGWAERAELLFALHNEHRIVTTRALAYAMSHLPGGVDFGTMIVVGCLALLVSLAVVARYFPPAARLPAITVVALIVLLPQQFNLMFFPMAAVQAYWGLLFFFLYLLLSLKDGKEYVAPVFFLAAVLTTGGGLFLFLPVCIALAMRRRWKALAFNVILALVVIRLYFWGVSRADADPVGYAMEHPLTVLRLFLGMTGSVAQVPSYQLGWLSAYTTPVAGVLLLLVAAHIARRIVITARREADATDIAILACLAYSLLTLAVIALNRARYYAELDLLYQATLDGRYRIYSLLLAAFCLSWFVRRLDGSLKPARRVLVATSLCLLAVHVMWSRYAAEESRLRAIKKTDTLQAWLKTGDASQLITLGAVTPETGAAILRRAMTAGVFVAPAR